MNVKRLLKTRNVEQISVKDDVNGMEMNYLINQALMIRQVCLFYYHKPVSSISSNKNEETVVAALGFEEAETYELVLFNRIGEPVPPDELLVVILKVVRLVTKAPIDRASETLKQIAIDAKPSIMICLTEEKDPTVKDKIRMKIYTDIQDRYLLLVKEA